MMNFVPFGYQFQDMSLLEMALRHPSSHRRDPLTSYERLEFLGDAILGMIIAEALYIHFPDEPEGNLAKRKAGLVNGKTLSMLAEQIQLGDALEMSDGEALAGGRENKANLENAYEALIGAIYLDSNLQNTTSLLLPFFTPLLESMVEPPSDPKTSLQEHVQALGMSTPHYEVLHQEGPAHAPVFTIEVRIESGKSATAIGSSKKAAEREAASRLLVLLR